MCQVALFARPLRSGGRLLGSVVTRLLFFVSAKGSSRMLPSGLMSILAEVSLEVLGTIHIAPVYWASVWLTVRSERACMHAISGCGLYLT